MIDHELFRYLDKKRMMENLVRGDAIWKRFPNMKAYGNAFRGITRLERYHNSQIKLSRESPQENSE